MSKRGEVVFTIPTDQGGAVGQPSEVTLSGIKVLTRKPRAILGTSVLQVCFDLSASHKRKVGSVFVVAGKTSGH
jgi:hypothetical protein